MEGLDLVVRGAAFARVEVEDLEPLGAGDAGQSGVASAWPEILGHVDSDQRQGQALGRVDGQSPGVDERDLRLGGDDFAPLARHVAIDHPRLFGACVIHRGGVQKYEADLRETRSVLDVAAECYDLANGSDGQAGVGKVLDEHHLGAWLQL